MASTNCIAAVPVPPPLQNFSTKYNHCHHPNSNFKSSLRSDCDWAFKYPDVQKATALAHICTETQPKYVRIKTNIKAIIQNGPTCGLTALNMLTGGIIPTDDILALAKRKQFTNHGEMFCAKNLQELATFLFDSLNCPVTIDLHSGELNCDHIQNELINGACVLVAYDSDFNHAPCLKNGHKAHWAVLIGCLIDNGNRFHVYVRHGKSKNLALWPIQSLSDSNSNLNEYTAPQRYDEYSFQMPIDGIAGKMGLKNQCIIINGIDNGQDFIRST